jgi:outer membrane receptor protein involved in Fe transport
MRLRSSFDGKINFILGAIWSESEGDYIYDIPATGLDALSLAPPAVLTGGNPVQLYPGLYRNASLGTTESTAIFGELYYDLSDRLRLTAGLRYTEDEKSQYTKLAFLNVVGFGAAGTGFTPLSGSLPDYGDAYRATTGQEPIMESNATTGRIVLDYNVNDDTMVYASISTGFKGGGFNPALEAEKYPNTPQIFPNMEITAYEIGLKAELVDQGLRFNASAYYYDASDYHVTKIVNKTNVNEGIDVDLYGFEADALWAPRSVPGLEFNVGIAWEKSDIADGEALLDPINPDLQLTQGSTDWHMMKDEVSEVFVARKDAAAAIYQAWITGSFVGTPLQDALIPAEFHGDRTLGQPTPVSFLSATSLPAEGHLPSLAVRAGYEAMAAALGYNPADVITDGLDSDVGGNSLTHPDIMANIGVQYTLPVGNFDVTARLDYYYQSEYYARIFNLSYDELESWSEMNAQITLQPQGSDKWSVIVYGQNITDEQNIMSLGLGSAAVGFTRGIAAREPRVYGVRLSYSL